MSQSIGSTIVALIESDLLTSAGGPLLTLLNAVQANKGNIVADTAAWLQFIGSLPSALIQAEGEALAQVAGILQTKLQASLSAAKPTGT